VPSWKYQFHQPSDVAFAGVPRPGYEYAPSVSSKCRACDVFDDYNTTPPFISSLNVGETVSEQGVVVHFTAQISGVAPYGTRNIRYTIPPGHTTSGSQTSSCEGSACPVGYYPETRYLECNFNWEQKWVKVVNWKQVWGFSIQSCNPRNRIINCDQCTTSSHAGRYRANAVSKLSYCGGTACPSGKHQKELNQSVCSKCSYGKLSSLNRTFSFSESAGSAACEGIDLGDRFVSHPSLAEFNRGWNICLLLPQYT
jgi:hypothetical protein